MRHVVYCSLISVEGTKLTYALGGYVTDMTGELVVDYKEGTYEVTRKPMRSLARNRHIETMLRKHHAEFQKGIFPEKMSYEI